MWFTFYLLKLNLQFPTIPCTMFRSTVIKTLPGSRLSARAFFILIFIVWWEIWWPCADSPLIRNVFEIGISFYFNLFHVYIKYAYSEFESEWWSECPFIIYKLSGFPQLFISFWIISCYLSFLDSVNFDSKFSWFFISINLFIFFCSTSTLLCFFLFYILNNMLWFNNFHFPCFTSFSCLGFPQVMWFKLFWITN